ncbi:MAG: DUF1365 domain-containing protein [Gammaproteobacteria bacterium]|nr:DUF1365 domain-containing protein [Gammaproteobacteria bacterium]
MHSRLYSGQVKHRRHTPVPHAFRYGMFMLYLDLDELPDLFSKRWLWSSTRPAVARFRREDHLGEASAGLADEVRRFVRDQANIVLEGPIRLLTNLRYFGCGFNPVSFYYCFDKSGERLELVVAEVNNTPWGEQYCYILPESLNRGNGGTKRFLLDKRFHVSPFMAMNIDYDWRFTTPAEKLIVHMKNYQDGTHLFDATLSLEEKPITGPALAGVLFRYPFMTVKIVAAIYYQALRLWLKKVPFVTHPDKLEAPETVRKS